MTQLAGDIPAKISPFYLDFLILRALSDTGVWWISIRDKTTTHLLRGAERDRYFDTMGGGKPEKLRISAMASSKFEVAKCINISFSSFF